MKATNYLKRIASLHRTLHGVQFIGHFLMIQMIQTIHKFSKTFLFHNFNLKALTRALEVFEVFSALLQT